MSMSWLIGPALLTNLTDKGIAAGVEAIMFDLEDSVPTDKKEAARQALAAHFQRPFPQNLKTSVRINALSSREGLRDIEFMLAHNIRPDSILLSKICGAAEITVVWNLFAESGKPVDMFVLVESVEYLCELRNATKKPHGLAGFFFGAADYAADLGVELNTADFNFVRYEIALIARNWQIESIDMPCFELDETRLRAQLKTARQLGLTGGVAIHPCQIKEIRKAFEPSPEEIEKAHRLLDAQRKDTSSFVRVGEGVYGPPFLKHAASVLARVRTGTEDDR